MANFTHFSQKHQKTAQTLKTLKNVKTPYFNVFGVFRKNEHLLIFEKYRFLSTFWALFDPWFLADYPQIRGHLGMIWEKDTSFGSAEG